VAIRWISPPDRWRTEEESLMSHPLVRCAVSGLGLLIGFVSTLDAASVTVATWTANPNTGGGLVTVSGTLGANSLTLQTAAVPPNAGSAFFEDWTATPATNAYVMSQSPTSGNTSIAIAQGASTTETLTFTTPLVNPVLLIDFGDPTVTYNFGTLSVTALSLNHASLSSGTLSFPGATDTDGDGAAIQVNGTFSTFSFSASDSGGRTDTQRFTVAVTIVPEPSSIVMGATASFVGLFWGWRKRSQRH
jgi:hypothetical protein